MQRVIAPTPASSNNLQLVFRPAQIASELSDDNQSISIGSSCSDSSWFQRFVEMLYDRQWLLISHGMRTIQRYNTMKNHNKNPSTGALIRLLQQEEEEEESTNVRWEDLFVSIMVEAFSPSTAGCFLLQRKSTYVPGGMKTHHSKFFAEQEHCMGSRRPPQVGSFSSSLV